MNVQQKYNVSEDVLNVLGRNLVVAGVGRRSGPDLEYAWSFKNDPATFLLTDKAIKSNGDNSYSLIDNRSGTKWLVIPGTNSEWVLFDADSKEEAKGFYLLSTGDPEIEICDWNTVAEITQVDENVYLVSNVSTINGEPASESKFNKVHKTVTFISGDPDESISYNLIGNIKDGVKVSDFGNGCCREGFVKIAFFDESDPKPYNILDINDGPETDGVDTVFQDNDAAPEYLVLIPIIGLKNISEDNAMPKLLINMQSLKQ